MEQKKDEPSATAELQADVKDLNERVSTAERKGLLDRVAWMDDYRFEAHTITGNVPAHFDGMMMQNLVVKTLFYAQTNGGAFPTSVNAINNNVAANYSQYRYFANNLTFSDQKAAMAQFSPSMQQQLFGMLMPATCRADSNANNILQSNRLRLKFDAQVADNVSVTVRLSMYKVFGDSSGVQVFNGQPNTLDTDDTTACPPATWCAWSACTSTGTTLLDRSFYLSIGRRQSTDGPPWNFRQDEPSGGTPSWFAD